MNGSNEGKEWIKNTNIYEVNVRQYTKEGTFNAFAPALPRLKDMGVQTLWFMPITPIAQKGKKGFMGSYYAAADYTAINPEFGDLNDFKNLVQAAHQLGFKVIIDWVANHTGWDHRWTWEHPDWYLKDDATGDFKIASGMDDIIELDYNNAAMRKAMIEAMTYWVQETDIDGFRCDLASWVQLDFWIEAKTALDVVKPLFWLGELDALESPEYMQVFDAAYTWTWMHQTKEFYQNRLPLSVLDNVLLRYQKAPGMKAWFTTNHDENTWNGTEYEKYGHAAKLLAVFSCTWPGLPLVYSGQEFPNLKRLKFFEKDPIEWTGHYDLHDFYKTLLNLHSFHPALSGEEKTSPVVRLHTTEDDKVFAYLRRAEEREVMVLLNFSDSPLTINIAFGVSGTFKNTFSGNEQRIDAQQQLELKGWEYLVFHK